MTTHDIIQNKATALKIKHRQIPFFEKWPGAMTFSKASNLLDDGQWDGLIQDRYEVVYHAGDGIWCIAGIVSTMDEANRLASTVHPVPLQVIPAGYSMTSTGDMVLQDDWDEIEGET